MPHLQIKEEYESKFALRPCTTTTSRNVKTAGAAGADSLSSLPDELIAGHILSLLPTKDAVATTALSRRWRRVFKWMTRLEFDDTPISHCVEDRRLVEKFTAFTAFVDNVLKECLSEDITSFRLKFGKVVNTHDLPFVCEKPCFPDVNPLQLNVWMCYPLTRGVKELDICALVSNPTGKVPLALFSSRTLEVLKLEVNLDFELPAAAPLCLPNLKVLHLTLVHIPDEIFVTRLLSSCPSIVDLALTGLWEPAKVIEISSPSLRRLVFRSLSYVAKQRCDIRLTAPNLEYLLYSDNFAWKYSIEDLNALIEAHLDIFFPFSNHFEPILSLLKPLFNVRYLYLSYGCVQALQGCEIKLPVFHNLSHLQLGYYCRTEWYEVLLDLLNCSPFLEILSFPEGISSGIIEFETDREIAESECQYWSTTQTIPSCLEFRLQKVVIGEYKRSEAELEMVKYFLRSALVLEELVVICKNPTTVAERRVLEDALQKLPTASMTCSIKVPDGSDLNKQI